MKENKKLNGYDLQKQFLNWACETTEPVRHIHYALIWVIIELNNQLGWIETFGLPTDSTMLKANINGRRHYYRALNELIRWGFITLHERSFNQYTCNRISLNMLDTLSNQQGIQQGSHNKTRRKTYKNKEPIVEKIEINLIPKDAR